MPSDGEAKLVGESHPFRIEGSIRIKIMENISIKKLTELVLEQAREKGFGSKIEEINVAEKIALIHSEVSEAYEAYRNKKIEGPDGFAEELGDIVQRILHLCGVFNIDIEQKILDKMARNKTRDWQWDNKNESHS